MVNAWFASLFFLPAAAALVLNRKLSFPVSRIWQRCVTPGNVADISMAIPLLETAGVTRRLLADKAYDADRLRNWLRSRRTTAVIPSSRARRIPYPLDRKAYRRRNVIERLFCRLKNWRRIATRYDRLAQNFLSAIALVAVVSEWA